MHKQPISKRLTVSVTAGAGMNECSIHGANCEPSLRVVVIMNRIPLIFMPNPDDQKSFQAHQTSVWIKPPPPLALTLLINVSHLHDDAIVLFFPSLKAPDLYHGRIGIHPRTLRIIIPIALIFALLRPIPTCAALDVDGDNFSIDAAITWQISDSPVNVKGELTVASGGSLVNKNWRTRYL